MRQVRPIFGSCCGRVSRRSFLADSGLGFTGLVLGAMLQHDGIARAATVQDWARPDGKPHFTPKAKSVIWIFMLGGVSHVESFDPKPALSKYGGKTIGETPYRRVLDSPHIKNHVNATMEERKLMQTLLPLQVGYRKRGQCGVEISDWWPHLSECADDIAFIRSTWTTDNDHGAQLQFHTGRQFFQGYYPSVGSWVHYGLGTLNENLPQFVVLGPMVATNCGGFAAVGGNYLGPEHSGVQLAVDPEHPLPFARPERPNFKGEQEAEFEFVQKLNRLNSVVYPDDASLRARIKSYELAFRMQTTIPELFRFEQENDSTRRMYGLEQEETKTFGQVCLTARRQVERGVRFVQVFHGGSGNDNNGWDAHSDLKENHTKLSAMVDQPTAGLLKDLKQRGMLDDTLVVWATEFGRSPGVEVRPNDATAKGGRDHHPFGFTTWMAGGGIKGGVIHGATDELGFHAIENRHYVTDIHATVLHQLGLDPRRLEVPGQKRLEIDFGAPIKEIMA
ncbi:MAG: DUF1501 domain-containing protein [Acidobacteria bacterium]|nr:MAG: DUF1501 domain-containing protein [Acidobacteriota bacterium]